MTALLKTMLAWFGGSVIATIGLVVLIAVFTEMPFPGSEDVIKNWISFLGILGLSDLLSLIGLVIVFFKGD